LAVYGEALALYRAVGSRLGEANTLRAQGQLFLGTGEEAAGLEHLERAHQLYTGVGDRVGLANVGITLARHAAGKADYAAAVDYMQPAVDFCLEIGHPLATQLQAEIDAWKAEL
jgi:hypothetical protein